MTKNEVNNEYFEWMFGLVNDARHSKRSSFRKLLYFLHGSEFEYSIPMDGNRYEDGIDLRYRFGDENGIDDAVIASYLDDSPCSVLEMLIALSIRIEEHIMDDPDIGNRTGQWFWDMLSNLGMDGMNDSKFDKRIATDILNRFLNREYKRNGEGGLFTICHCKRDLRNVDIWYQAMWYLDEVLKIR